MIDKFISDMKGMIIVSISSSIDIKLVDKYNSDNFCWTIIHTLKNNGWKLFNDRKVLYLPLGDNDEYDWRREELTVDELKAIIEEKEKSNEVVGIELTWENTKIGGDLLIFDTNGFSFNITVNKKFINDDNLTKIIDISWYIEKLIPYLLEHFIIEHISFEQHY